MVFGLAYKAILIQVNGFPINLMDMGLEFGEQMINMRDNGKMDWNMDLEQIYIEMVTLIMDILNLVFLKDLGNTFGKMEIFLMDNLKKVLKMDMEFW